MMNVNEGGILRFGHILSFHSCILWTDCEKREKLFLLFCDSAEILDQALSEYKQETLSLDYLIFIY